ncbi:MAG: 50S ribosomal protein L10 [archaeon]
MAKTRQQKKESVVNYSAKLQEYGSFFVVKPLSVNPNEATAIKKELSALGSSYNLVKNSLFEVALKENNLPVKSLGLGQHAVIFSSDKVSETAKVVSKFLKNAKAEVRMEITAGVLNGTAISAEQVQALADLPSKDVLLAQLLSVMNGPLRSFMYVLKGNMQELVYLLNAVQEQKVA